MQDKPQKKARWGSSKMRVIRFIAPIDVFHLSMKQTLKLLKLLVKQGTFVQEKLGVEAAPSSSAQSGQQQQQLAPPAGFVCAAVSP